MSVLNLGHQRMDQWHGKIALVTGASAGIGANICVSLANAGMIVIGLARRVKKVNELQQHVTGSGQIVGMKVDLLNDQEIVDAFKWVEEHYGGADVLINNAGILVSGGVVDQSIDVIRKTFDLNVVAATLCVQEVIKSLRKRGAKGHIVVLSSDLGHRIPDVPKPIFGIYPASKYAITALSQLVRSEMAYLKAPIKFTAICPSMTNTDLIETFPQEFRDHMTKLEPEDVTAAVLYALGTPDRVQVEEIILQALHPTA